MLWSQVRDNIRRTYQSIIRSFVLFAASSYLAFVYSALHFNNCSQCEFPPKLLFTRVCFAQFRIHALRRIELDFYDDTKTAIKSVNDKSCEITHCLFFSGSRNKFHAYLTRKCHSSNTEILQNVLKFSIFSQSGRFKPKAKIRGKLRGFLSERLVGIHYYGSTSVLGENCFLFSFFLQF